MFAPLLRAKTARLAPMGVRFKTSLMSDVHGTTHGKKHWKNKPLFRREGDKKFRNGQEAADMLMEEAIRRDPHQSDFLQAVTHFVNSVVPVFDRYPKYAWVMKTLMEPERVIQFRVPWIDDTGSSRVNRGFRVQFSSSLGPYMGGLRFHPQTNHSAVKFLAFEAVFRNALAGSYGGAHGGSDFNPVDKSEAEVMRFCQSYMTELANYIGPHTDTPMGGVGVGPKEIGYMFGQYKRLRQLHSAGSEGIISGAYYYPEATGYGVAHFANRVLESRGESLKGKRCLISGAGVVALNVAEKLLDLGAIPIGMSDYFGYVIEPEGFTKKNIQELKRIKADRSARIGGYIMSSTSALYHPAEEASIWDTPCDYAFPCAIQNDINGESAKKLIKNGCKGVFEGASLPCTEDAIELFKHHNLAFGPNKVANSGSFALVRKNLGTTDLSPEELDTIIKDYMYKAHDVVAQTAEDFNTPGDLDVGANIAAFVSVAEAMFRQGVVVFGSEANEVQRGKSFLDDSYPLSLSLATCDRVKKPGESSEVRVRLVIHPEQSSEATENSLPFAALSNSEHLGLGQLGTVCHSIVTSNWQEFGKSATTHAGRSHFRTSIIMRLRVSSMWWLLCSHVVAAAFTTTSNTNTNTSICNSTALSATSESIWTLQCNDEEGATASSSFLNFDPSQVTNFYVNSAMTVMLDSQEPTQVELSSTFAYLGPLISTTLTTFSLTAEPSYVHQMPVEIEPTAFEQLSALQVLELQDIPLANPELHIVLPRSIQQIIIVGCGLKKFSFELADDSSISSSKITHIDLHSNALSAIPDEFYDIKASAKYLDIRLNQFIEISVTSTNKPTLTRWMKNGILQVDNVVASHFPCSDGVLKEIQGLSQTFTVCVLNPDPVKDKIASETAASSQVNDAFGSLPIAADSSSYQSTKTAGTDGSNSTYNSSTIILVAIIMCVVLIALAIGVCLIRRRHVQAKRQQLQLSGGLPPPFDKPTLSSRSLFTSMATDDFSILRRSNSLSSSSSSFVMMTPAPESLIHHRPKSSGGRNGNGKASSATAATPTLADRRSYHYDQLQPSANISPLSMEVTPAANGFLMSKNLQSLTGVGAFSGFSDMGKPKESRYTARKKLRLVLEASVKDRKTIEINKQKYIVYGKLTEMEHWLAVNCQPVHDSEISVDTKLVLRFYIEHDRSLAANECRALQILKRDESCMGFVPQLLDIASENEFEGTKCSVLLLEAGSATTLLHIARGQLDKSNQFSVIQQFSRVLDALECLHSREFVHGSLHMESLVLHNHDQLKFQSLEHSTRFGCPIDSYAEVAVEYLAPEMARYALYDSTEDESNDTVRVAALQASYSLDVWSLGVLLLKMYATSKHLDEFRGCDEPRHMLQRVAEPSFTFERSIALYVPHEDVKQLLRLCLNRQPSQRPTIEAIRRHRVLQAYEQELFQLQQAPRPSSIFVKHVQSDMEPTTPPTLCFFLPPEEIGLDVCFTVDEWITHLTIVIEQHKVAKTDVLFPLLFMCESDMEFSTCCVATGPVKAERMVALSMVSLVAPLVQETKLFLEAKAMLSSDPVLHIAEASGLSLPHWMELTKFYYALDKMALIPVNSFSAMTLKPLEELLASEEKEAAQQVMDELKCLVFSQEKREFVQSLLDVLSTTTAVSGKREKYRRIQNAWSGLAQFRMEDQHTTNYSIRWLCPNHASHEQ